MLSILLIRYGLDKIAKGLREMADSHPPFLLLPGNYIPGT